jgi:hypothetical protein
MQKETKKVKEKVKIDKNDVAYGGVLVDLNYDYVIDIGGGRFESPKSGKRYREIVNLNSTNDMGDHGRY